MEIADINCTTIINPDCVCHKEDDVGLMWHASARTLQQPDHIYHHCWMTRWVVSILNYMHRKWCLLFIIKQAYANLLTKLMEMYNLTSSKGSSNLV